MLDAVFFCSCIPVMKVAGAVVMEVVGSVVVVVTVPLER